jgi:type IV secretion system protein VirB4
MLLIIAVTAFIAVGIFLEVRHRRGSRPFDALKEGRSQSALAELLAYHRLVKPNVILLKDDAYLAVWRIAAPDVGSLDDQSVINVARRTAAALAALPPTATVQFYERRVASSEYDRPQRYPSPLFRGLDDRRQAVFTQQRLFRSERYCSLTWRMPSAAQATLRAVLDTGSAEAAAMTDAWLADFDALCATVEAQFGAALEMTRLGERLEVDPEGVERRRSDLLAFIASCIDGRDAPFNAPPPGTSLDDLLSVDYIGGYQPRVGDDAVACVVLKTYPDATVPRLLSRIAEMRVRHLLSVRFMPLDAAHAKKLMRNRAYDWAANATFDQAAGDPDAEEMAQDARKALGVASRDVHRFGLTTITVTLRDRERARVDAAAREVIALLEAAGFRAFVPKVAAWDTWLGVPPGMNAFDCRRVPLTVINVAHLFPLHHDSRGARYAESPTLPPRTPPVAYALTPGNTQYRLHLSAGDDDTFHGVAVGAPGRGKSTLLAALAAGWCGRMPAAGMSAIDRGRSLYRLTRWVGGNFYDLLGANSPGFALFDALADPHQVRTCLDILEEMCELQGVPITPPRRASLEQAMRVMPTYPPELRNLTAFVEVLSDPEDVLRAALRPYTAAGSLGTLLDATTDTWSTGMWNVVDVSNVIGMREKFLIPILRVVFWKLMRNARELRRVSGNHRLHWIYHIDEAHALLTHTLGQRFILELLKMGRKELAGIWLWSQSVTDFARTPILEDILKAAGTRIWFGDTGATPEAPELLELYQGMELPARGIRMLPEMPKWSFLFQQPAARELRELRLDLSPAELAVFGRSRPGDNQLVDALIAEYPDTWRIELLRRENITLSEADATLLTDLRTSPVPTLIAV